MFSVKSSLNIVATILARNEEDIIGNTIEHHIKQGVSTIILTNNNSTDRTKEIAERYPEVKEIIDEPGDDHSQSKWVTRMARLACKFNPDWIIHLDADELWCGLSSLRYAKAHAMGSVRMYLHPPVGGEFSIHRWRRYLDFDHIERLPGECKVIHRPDPEVIVTHGNHGLANDVEVVNTTNVWRHHYPIRSIKQFAKKAIDGHLALKKRNSVCERWQNWYNCYLEGKIDSLYEQICNDWNHMVCQPGSDTLKSLLSVWSTRDVIEQLTELPRIGEWPRVYP